MVKNLTANARDIRQPGSTPGVGKSLEGAWQPTAAFLLGEAHGQRSLAGYGPYGCTESDTTEAA